MLITWWAVKTPTSAVGLLTTLPFFCLLKRKEQTCLPAGREKDSRPDSNRVWCGTFPLSTITRPKSGIEKHHYIDHFAPANKQDGMNCLDRTAGADRVIKVNYARGLRGRFKAYDRVFKLLMFKKGQINRHSGFNAIYARQRAACSTESVQPRYFPSADFGIEKVQPEKCYRIKTAWTFGPPFLLRERWQWKFGWQRYIAEPSAQSIPMKL